MRWFSPYNRFERNVLRNIKKHGCHINHVYSEPDRPEFGYSVGFQTTAQQPEVIILGTYVEETHSIINGLLDCCRNGLVLADNCKVENVGHGVPLVMRKVHPSQIVIDWLNSAMWYSETILERPLTEVFQAYWPSAHDGKYPWEEGAMADFVALQPSLQIERSQK